MTLINTPRDNLKSFCTSRKTGSIWSKSQTQKSQPTEAQKGNLMPLLSDGIGLNPSLPEKKLMQSCRMNRSSTGARSGSYINVVQLCKADKRKAKLNRIKEIQLRKKRDLSYEQKPRISMNENMLC